MMHILAFLLLATNLRSSSCFSLNGHLCVFVYAETPACRHRRDRARSSSFSSGFVSVSGSSFGSSFCLPGRGRGAREATRQDQEDRGSQAPSCRGTTSSRGPPPPVPSNLVLGTERVRHLFGLLVWLLSDVHVLQFLEPMAMFYSFEPLIIFQACKKFLQLYNEYYG